MVRRRPPQLPKALPAPLRPCSTTTFFGFNFISCSAIFPAYGILSVGGLLLPTLWTLCQYFCTSYLNIKRTTYFITISLEKEPFYILPLPFPPGLSVRPALAFCLPVRPSTPAVEELPASFSPMVRCGTYLRTTRISGTILWPSRSLPLFGSDFVIQQSSGPGTRD